MLSYYLLVLPLLFTLNANIGKDFEFCSLVFLLYMCTLHFGRNDLAKNLGFPLSTFLLNIAIKNNQTNGIIMLIMSVIIYSISLFSDKYNIPSPNKILFGITSFTFSGLTYYYQSPILGCFSVATLFLRILLECKNTLYTLNLLLDSYGIETIEESDKTLHLLIWFQLKIYYVLLNTFDFLKIFIFGFHCVAGIAFMYRLISGLIESEIGGKTYMDKIIIFGLMVALIMTNFAFVFRVVTVLSFVVYTYLYQYDLSQFHFRIVMIIDLIFTLCMLSNMLVTV